MRVVTRALSSLGRVSGHVSTVSHYLAASTLGIADIKAGIRRSWEDYNSGDGEIGAGLMAWERDLVERFVHLGASVLVIGSGSGRDLIPLIERGCRVTGVEPASIALGIARRVLAERQLPATLVGGFFEDVDLAGAFDAVMFSYYSYSYIPESRRRVAVLRKAATHLTEGGHVLISYPKLERPRQVAIRLARVVGSLCRSDWRLEPGDFVRLAGASYDYEHAFEPGEIEKEAAAAGLRVVYRRDFSDERILALSL
jgi:SAM-dependent methyltransferase